MARALQAYERIVELGGASARAERVAEMRRRFEARTGAFAPEDAWFEERSRAFWTDAATRGGFARAVADELPDEHRAWVAPFERAHRGLFRCASPAEQRRFLLVDVWSGTELWVDEADDASRAELGGAEGQLFDGRVVGSLVDRLTTALLPGAVFHAHAAADPIRLVLETARARELPTEDTLDALLRMARTLRSLSRVKATYAYRVEALSPDAPSVPHGSASPKGADPRPDGSARPEGADAKRDRG